jgi:hypothetical protein
MASTLTISSRIPSSGLGTSQDTSRSIEVITGLDVTTAVTDAELLDVVVIPAAVADRKGVARLAPLDNTLLEFSIGHATTPVGKTATVYIVGVKEKVAAHNEPVIYKRVRLGQLAITGDRALVSDEVTGHASKFSGFAAWATCSIVVSASYLPLPGIVVIGDGAGDNAPEAAFDSWGYAWIEVWVVNGAASQGVVVDFRQC